MPRVASPSLLLFAAVTLIPAVAVASQVPAVPPDLPEMITDRPDFTESSQVIPAGGVQFESGVVVESDSIDGQRRRGLTAPSALLRIGVGRRVELRLGAEGLLTEFAVGQRTTGFSDVEVGAKVQLLDQASAPIDLALLPMASLPAGSRAFSSGGADPTLKITWGRDLPAGFGLAGNVNLSSFTDLVGRFHQRAASVSLAHGLPAAFGGYVEVFGFSRLSPGGAAAVLVNGGVTRSVGRHLQLDIEAGRGLTLAAPDWFAGVGLAVRRLARPR